MASHVESARSAVVDTTLSCYSALFAEGATEHRFLIESRSEARANRSLSCHTHGTTQSVEESIQGGLNLDFERT
jgi:hypothetical protein